MTDADTLRNADDLWGLVHLVQEMIRKDGTLVDLDEPRRARRWLARLRKLADECDPENAKD